MQHERHRCAQHEQHRRDHPDENMLHHVPCEARARCERTPCEHHAARREGDDTGCRPRATDTPYADEVERRESDAHEHHRCNVPC